MYPIHLVEARPALVQRQDLVLDGVPALAAAAAPGARVVPGPVAHAQAREPAVADLRVN